MAEIPEIIYLQWYGTDWADVDDEPISHDEVTWCKDEIYSSDIAYKRLQGCVWRWVQKWGYEVSNYETSCGESIERRDGNYCPFCGGRIEILD